MERLAVASFRVIAFVQNVLVMFDPDEFYVGPDRHVRTMFGSYVSLASWCTEIPMISDQPCQSWEIPAHVYWIADNTERLKVRLDIDEYQLFLVCDLWVPRMVALHDWLWLRVTGTRTARLELALECD